MTLQIVDRPGKISVAEMRNHFEQAVRQTEQLADNTPLGAMQINGAFSHYMDHDTDTMWLGFALGMRCAERIAKQKEAK